MRFYCPDTGDRVETEKTFPKLSEEEASKKCLRLGLLPSVTTILGTFREEWLERFFIKEGIKFYKELGDVKAAVDAVYTRESPNANFGTECHAIMESVLLKTPTPDVSPEAKKHAAPLVKWIRANVKRTICAERCLLSRELGCAGTVDMVVELNSGEMVVGDLKVVGFSRKYPHCPGLGYRCQLSAYAEMMRIETGTVFSRKSFYLASPFAFEWDMREPALEIFNHTQDFLPIFIAAREIWKAHLTMESLVAVKNVPPAAPAWEPTRTK